MRAAAITLDVIVGQRQAQAREVQRLAGVVEHRVVGVGHRQHAALQRVRLDAAMVTRRARALDCPVLTRTSPCAVQPSTVTPPFSKVRRLGRPPSTGIT
jgi:hypothetical protein